MTNSQKVKVQADFDRIALLSGEGWDHNSHYHNFLLRQVPKRCEKALEIGCGTGAFTRRLAQKAGDTLGLDLSPQMIRLARERSVDYLDLHFEVADVTSYELGRAQYDCIASIATLHHLPTEETLQRLRQALKPGGVLLILDLYEAKGFGEIFTSLLAIPLSRVLKLLKTGRLNDPPEVRAAWEEHGRTDRYLTLVQVRQIGANVLPGAKVRKHLLWRYSLVWRKV